MKKIGAVCVMSFLLSILGAVSVLASSSLEENRHVGSITIRLEDTEDNRSKENVHIRAAKIAEIVDGEYVLCSKYKDSGIDLNTLQNADELANAAEKLEQLKPEGKETITDVDGVAVITDLSTGVYLVYACDIAEYDNIMPAFIAVPMWDEVAKKMVYDIEVFPKHDSPIQEIPNAPQTGDGNHAKYYIITLAGAVTLGGLWFCEKRKKVELYKKSKM